jgi:glycosyltransferase involved in cell wall biosynthesis
VRAIQESAREAGLEYEVIVVDDASTDGTGEIARDLGVRVVRVNHRQIAATRNSGAREARGERIFFVDADTTINARVVAAAMRQMDRGAVGGGAPFWAEGAVPLYAKVIAQVGGLFCTLAGFAGGAFIFCTREAFEATGGFSERVYCGEEAGFTLALKREGKFVMVWERVLTSGRRFRKLSGMEVLWECIRIVAKPKRVTQRKGVEKIWYDSNREDDERLPNSVWVRISNGLALILILVLVTGPLWNFVPRSLTPWTSVAGKFRFACAVVLTHAGLLFVPIAVVLLWNFSRQKRWTGTMQSVTLIALCGWQGANCVRGVMWVWEEIWISMKLWAN